MIETTPEVRPYRENQEQHEFLESIKNVSYNDLQARWLELTAVMVNIRGQLDLYEHLSVEEKTERVDWHRRALAASRHIGWKVNALQSTMNTLKRSAPQLPRTFGAHFMDVAYELLDPDTFKLIRLEARTREQAGMRSHDEGAE